jgi:hypothetical protein
LTQLIGIPLGKFRFRGRTKVLSLICAEFKAHPTTGLHAAQIARATGLSLPRVNELLSETPELFVRLPKRDGITRYRLATRLSGQTPEDIDRFVRQAARSESLTLYAILGIVLAVVVMGAVMTLPMFTSSGR